MKTKLPFILLLFLLLLVPAVAQFRTLNGTFPTTSTLLSTDAMLIGRPGVTNYNMYMSNVVQELFNTAGATVTTTNLVSRNFIGNGGNITNVAFTNIFGGGTPTVLTNVSYWTFTGPQSGMPNGGGSGLANGASVSLLPGSTDRRGWINLYMGTGAGTATTNLCTLHFSTPFATAPNVICQTIGTNAAVSSAVLVRDTTTSNCLFWATATIPAAGNRYIISYQVTP